MAKEKKNIDTDGIVLTHLFNYDLDQCSPVVEDRFRKVQYDEEGNEIVTFEKVDYAKIQESNGFVNAWTLDALLKAGIDPAFPIHTGLNSRIEGVEIVARAEEYADKLLSDLEENK